MFAYGAQYYRPPNPPSDVWADDLEQMADLGFNTVKLWAMWNHTHPAEDEFDFSELDELVEIARENGLRVAVSLILENAPHWLAERYPAARYEDQNGLKVDLRARPNTPGGGWPGLCLNHPGVREEAERYTRALAGHFSDEDAVASYTTWDEAFFEPNLHFPDKRFCYCDACTDEFRQWLRDRYGDLDGLNDGWETRHTDWQQVEPPAFHGGYPRFLDWLRFRLDSHQRHMQWRADALDDADDTAIVRAHGISGNLGDLPHRFNDDWRSATTVDEWGTTTFPHWGPDHPDITTDARRQTVDHHLMLDVARGAAQGRSFWQTELQGGHVRSGNSVDPMGLTRGPSPDRESVGLWNWNALAGGASGVMYWQYRPELLGHESPGFGLVRRDGSTTERTDVAAEFANLVDRHPVLEAATPVRGDVAIGVLPEGPLFNYVAEKDTDQFASAVRGTYRALWNTDYRVDFAKPHQFDDYGVVFLPFPLLLSHDTVDHVESYVSGGGMLVTGGAPAVYDHNGRAFRRPPGRGLEEVFGTRLRTTRHDGDESLSLSTDRDASVDEHNVTVPSAARRDVFDPESATPIGYWSDGGVGATSNEYGDGTAVALGTLVGSAYGQTDEGKSIRTLLTNLAVRGDVVPRVRTSEPNVQTRLHRHDDGWLLYLVNPALEKETVDVRFEDLPSTEGKTIGDVQVLSDDPLRVTVDERSGGVLRFEGGR
ncbi:beta-galactosidase [Halomicrococcus sp. SG-WS-1]|uniref:beta-galactosidase n=1 Tax=Halomicrococcus sp. SG-WS-1 TaxID=3439057 RepID=UPI003F7AB012